MDKEGSPSGEDGGKTKKIGGLALKKKQKKIVDLLQEQVEEEEPVVISLLDRSDTGLTHAEILEKDGLMYDMLMAEEEVEEEEIEVVAVEEVVEEEVVVEEEIEEEEMTVEEEEVEEEEVPEETAAEGEPPMDLDDPDNIINMMMQQQDGEDEDLKLLFTDQSMLEQEVDTVAKYPGVVGITLSEETKEFLELGNLSEREPTYAFVSFKRIKLHLYIYGEKSEFFEHYVFFKNYPDFSMLLGLDFTRSTGHPYYLCATIEARNMVLNPPRKKRVYVDLKKKEEEVWTKMASLYPRKWRSLGSEVEVEAENVQTSRPLLTVYAYRDRDKFNNVDEYKDRTVFTNPEDYVAFEPRDKLLHPRIECKEMDVAVQVMPQKTTSTTQTGFSFKRNKMNQYENQVLDPEKVTALMDISPELVIKKCKPLQRAILQNEMMNLNVDDYKLLKAVKGHEVEYSNESILLQEYQTYCDLRHSKGRFVSYMVFHPSLEDVVVMSMAVDATFDKRIDFHSEMLMEPNFVLFWDLKDPIHPQFMLDAPNDVFSFMINPSDPHLVCGGCANGQVVLWDLGKHHSELRARIQDRRRKNRDTFKRKPSFLEKLKDNAEKYACPLIPTVGLSNLDQSHKRVVSAVCWLPPHVELGKNGTLYENSAGGRSVQFFSSAGDGSLRLWDTRPPRMGMEEFDVAPNKDIIKVNPWLHLENNLWKFTAKYQLDDGSGTMFATLLSLSEPKIGDIVTMDSLGQRSTSSTSSVIDMPGSPKLRKSSETLDAIKSKRSIIGGPALGGPSSEDAGGAGPGPVVDAEAISAASRRAAGMLNVLSNALTSIFIGTETGQIVLVDWLRNKDGSINPDTGTRVCQNMYIETIHDGAITSIARSPFYNNLILVVGGGTVSIWKENTSNPLLATSGSEYFPWCGCWSNTRPAVFFVGTREGALQVWDLTEKSHAPVLVQQISPGRLTNCAIPKATLSKKQFLALSDSVGNLFVMLLPRYYYKPTQFENNMMQELMTREEKRITNWSTDIENRMERIDAIHSAWAEGRIYKTPEQEQQIEIKVEERLNNEYVEFLEFQTKLVGRLKREEPTLPTAEGEQDEEFDALIQEVREREQEARARGELVESTSTLSIGSDNDFY